MKQKLKKKKKKEGEKITLKNLVRRVRSFFFEGVGGVCYLFSVFLDNVKITGKFLVLQKGKALWHFSAVTSQCSLHVTARNRIPSLVLLVSTDSWSQEFTGDDLGKERERISPWALGEVSKMLPHTPVPDAIPHPESKFEPIQLCILNVASKCILGFKRKHLAKIKSLVHLIKWMRCTKVSNFYALWLNMNLMALFLGLCYLPEVFFRIASASG